MMQNANKLYCANRGRVTTEYVMLHQINDTIEHAQQLAACLKHTPSKINLIPWNPFPGSSYRTSPTAQIERFAEKISDYGFTVTVRKTRGGDIDAACGQLAGEVVDRTQRKIKIGELIALRQVGG